jgi:hypothetical protein
LLQELLSFGKLAISSSANGGMPQGIKSVCAGLAHALQARLWRTKRG